MSTWSSVERREATERTVTLDLLRPLRQTSWRFYLLVADLGSIVLTGLATWLYQMYWGFGMTGIRNPIFWGVLHHELRVLDRHQPRRDPHLRDSPPGQCGLAPSGDAVRRGVRAHDRRVAPDHPSRAAVAVLYILQVDFVLRDAVPNAFIRVNPLGIQISYVRVDQAFEEPRHD